jgi:hypothetical protein
MMALVDRAFCLGWTTEDDLTLMACTDNYNSTDDSHVNGFL